MKAQGLWLETPHPLVFHLDDKSLEKDIHFEYSILFIAQKALVDPILHSEIEHGGKETLEIEKGSGRFIFIFGFIHKIKNLSFRYSAFLH